MELKSAMQKDNPAEKTVLYFLFQPTSKKQKYAFVLKHPQMYVNICHEVLMQWTTEHILHYKYIFEYIHMSAYGNSNRRCPN